MNGTTLKLGCNTRGEFFDGRITRLLRSGAPTVLLFLVATQFAAPLALCEPITHITIDGNFGDWVGVPAHGDAALGEFHTGTHIPDVHDTGPWNPTNPLDIPQYTNHPDVDLREFRFTHDESNLYAYFKSAGIIGRTQYRPPGTSLARGRYYVIVTIDVDNSDTTGYWLHEGGYAPTSNGYDMNMELEFYDGSFNTGHYLSHDSVTGAQYAQDLLNLTAGQYNGISDGPYPIGFVEPAAGNYDIYSQWVYHDNDTLTLVSDGDVPVPGIMSYALSADGHEIEIRAPFKGFLKTSAGVPNMALGKTIDISFSLEASGQLVPGGIFGSDTGDPINGYFLGGEVPEPSSVFVMTALLAALAAHRGKPAFQQLVPSARLSARHFRREFKLSK